jgi:anthranilate synthase component 1
MYKLTTTHKKILADSYTPVSVYLKIRDKFPNSILLESSDYRGNENSFSFICFNQVAHIKVDDGVLEQTFPDGKTTSETLSKESDVPAAVSDYIAQFKVVESDFKFMNNGLFGYTSFEAVQYFEDITLGYDIKKSKKVPELFYGIYQFVIAINHFKSEAHIFKHECVDMKNGSDLSLEDVSELMCAKNFSTYTFTPNNDEVSNCTDEEYIKMIRLAKDHCKRGDVFQLVLSREFSQTYSGDDFNLYRALRSINPSPYLFYFDYGSFKIFGSSPEAQIIIKEGHAEIHPIAGTFKRTGDDKKDAKLAEQLLADPKENAEHVMLVDLARNDLSRSSDEVQVKNYREVQFFSHVIHLVSKVTGKLKKGTNTMQVVADTFPAGTLSGAPKHKALSLISKYEKNHRSIYGGCIGYLGFNGDFNQAIIIRSFLSKNNTLFYQAGAGIVEQSNEESEKQEVFNKLAALHKAIEIAGEIN